MRRAEFRVGIGKKRGEGREVISVELLEEVLHRDNLNLAYGKEERRQSWDRRNGVDELLPYLREHGESIREEEYKPQPVRRVKISKPDGGLRLLGIPAVTNRMIQQTRAQVLIPIFEKEFSGHSYVFRRGHNAHQAIRQTRVHIRQ